MQCHRGFAVLYQSIQEYLHSLINKYCKFDTQILTTGLSLGGALSTLCCLDLQTKYHNQIIHYSYASPRVFNIIGANYFNSKCLYTYRIINISDVIPLMPLPMMDKDDFMHVKGMTAFDTNLKTYYKNHIDAYCKEYNLTIY